MKALKLKSSTNENPVWGETYEFIGSFREITITIDPPLFKDIYTIEFIKEKSFERCADQVDKWELVPIEIKVSLP